MTHTNTFMSTLSAGGGAGGFMFRGVWVKIKRVENGFFFELEGMKRKEKRAKNDYQEWESFEAEYVFNKLEDGLKEVQGFFDLIEKQLERKTNDKPRKVHKRREKTDTNTQWNGTKRPKGRPRKS